MRRNRFSRRDVLKGTGALAAGTVFASPLSAAAPPPSAITPELIAAAKKEGKVVYYTSIDLPLAEKIAKSFEAKFPGVAVRVERTGAERVFQRIGQEYSSNIHAVDVVNSSDASHLIVWKREGLLAPFVPEDVAKHYPDAHRDPDGMFASFRIGLCIIAYNTNLVKAEDAPKSFADLLDPKWKGKLVKAHPGYSGTIVTSTLAVSKTLGWEYLEKLGQQQVLQVQSAVDPPRKVALGERPVMVDGAEASTLQLIQSGAPIVPVYPVEGTPAVTLNGALMKQAPHPNAARLFMNFMFSREGQQIFVEYGFRSVHPDVREPSGRTPLSEIKLLRTDPEEQERAGGEIKARYARYFGT